MYKLNEEKMFFDIADGQAVVINFVTGMYYGTSTLGSAVLEKLVQKVSSEKILAALAAADGCPADMGARLDAFIKALSDKEIIVPADTEDLEVSFDSSAFADGFELTLDEFAEVQDLLLADPIHDVDVEEGWPVKKDDEE
jgi:hypothetical protein